jgi:hypothetical protein
LFRRPFLPTIHALLHSLAPHPNDVQVWECLTFVNCASESIQHCCLSAKAIVGGSRGWLLGLGAAVRMLIRKPVFLRS